MNVSMPVVFSTLSLLAVMPSGAQEGPPARALAAFVGQWDMELVAETASFGDRGGPGRGTMSCAWGPEKAWVDCELDSEYTGLGRYHLKIVLYRSGDRACGAFVANSFGGGRLYLGRWENGDTLVFDDAWVDASRAWPHQRITYRFGSDGTIRFSIGVSKDGDAYLPHSAGVYHPR